MFCYKERKQRYLLNVCVCIHKLSNKQRRNTAVAGLVSVTGHAVAVGVFNCLLPLPCLCLLGLQQPPADLGPSLGSHTFILKASEAFNDLLD